MYIFKTPYYIPQIYMIICKYKVKHLSYILYLFIYNTRSPITHSDLEFTMYPRITLTLRDPCLHLPKCWETLQFGNCKSFFFLFPSVLNFTLKSCLSIFRQQILCLKRNRNKVRSETASAGKNTTQHHVEQNRQDSCL